ncbi:clarin-2-like isoform X1 [Mizuhopecten yessoensis]|uniref:clarin-2-like isoform X1 n=1 Tax=Mizuhopecten yessoensis TaxID=6573 RepID=UPI000B45758D|nr:clarin-2-like isoform X1 [Mizuhopecten yessoensis]
MGETKKVFIGLTIYVSLAAIGLVVAAFVTEHWISAFAQKKNNTLSRNASETVGKFTGNITFGLFAGTRKVNYGVGAREQTIEVVCDGAAGYCLLYNTTAVDKKTKLQMVVDEYNNASTVLASSSVKKELYEFGLFPYGLWVATIVLSALGMAWGLVSIGFSIFNIAGKPIETITGPMGLYLWNGLALLFTALGMVMYLVLYFRYYQYNVLPLEDRLADYTTENNTDLDYSFYLLVAATGLYFINLLFLIFSGAKLKCGFTREADKVIDNGIILY